MCRASREEKKIPSHPSSFLATAQLLEVRNPPIVGSLKICRCWRCRSSLEYPSSKIGRCLSSQTAAVGWVRILSINDGTVGAFDGLLTGVILACLEASLCKLFGNPTVRIVDFFARGPNEHPLFSADDALCLTKNHSQVFEAVTPISPSLINSAASKPTRPGTLLASTTIPAHAGDGEYITTVGFGTPNLNFTVIFDTGSDLTWIQCKPCVDECYPQKEPLFDPSHSSTYSNISCNSDDRSSTSDDYGCDPSNCVYEVQYGDGSFSVGFFARETVMLTPSNRGRLSKVCCQLPQSNSLYCISGFYRTHHTTAPDLDCQQAFLKASNQTESRAIFLDTSSNGYLTIAAGVQNSLDVKFTRMITESYLPSFYSLELIGMSVGGKDLAIPSTAFTDVGTIFDSGTTITWLPPAAYSALSSEFRQHMSKHSLVTPLGKLDTCYNFTGYNRIRVPAIALQFSGGVMLNVDASGILLFASPLQGCLAFASNDKDEFSIVGNMQQRTFDVVYAIMSRVESMDDEVGEYIEGSSGVRM
uniref:Aspartyl protease family protein At5g10770-like n=1 Tax=Elaeis guineensis var. tenera TaxID=51953 RepID=A0A6J0PEB5_ELAGV|nr:aspartyl protease family protein At5g10770-like [Elaeis guineensis]